MSIDTLKNILLEEHYSDKKIVTRFYTIVAFLILALIVFIAVKIGPAIIEGIKANRDAGVQTIPSWGLFILPVIPLIWLAFPIVKLYNLSKREVKIEELISKLRNNTKASQIITEKSYRVIIPLYYVNFHLYPIEMLHITLSIDNSTYKLPVSKHYLTDIKTMLSGADANAVNKAWVDLDKNNTQYNNPNVVTTLKSIDEFKTFVQTNLKDNLQDVEQNRLSTKKKMMIGIAFSAIVFIGWFGFQYYMANKSDYTGMTGEEVAETTKNTSNIIMTVFGFVVGFIYLGYFVFYKQSKNAAQKEGLDYTFKTKILEKIIHFINPAFQYVMHGHIGVAEFLDSGLFIKNRYDIDGNDQILGSYNGVPFQYCDANVKYESSWQSKNEAPAEVFYGQYFIASFNKSFSNPVYVIPNKSLVQSYTDNAIKEYINTDLGDKIQLEDPAFSKMFDVYGIDQIEARYILTTSLMQRIKDLVTRTKGNYYIAFNNNRITLANNNRQNKLEASVFTSLTKDDALLGYYKDLCDQFAIIDELKLNINIWKKII